MFERERRLRLQAERERDDIERKLTGYQQQMKQIHDTLVRFPFPANPD